MSDEFKPSYEGYEVRRLGVEYVGLQQSTQRRPVGIVVELFAHPIPDCPTTGSDADKEMWHTQATIARSLPAQITVYWQDTRTIEYLMETQVQPNYPGGSCYRAWDGEFPILAVETGGYGDITVLTPDGERAVFIMDNTPHERFTHEQWRAQVLEAVGQYLDSQVPAEQLENAG